MIPCTDFIPAYSELFKYLDEVEGPDAVQHFWEYISDNFLGNLRDLVVENGIRGCWMYWSHTLNEEAADFTMELDEDKGEFSIHMHYCPSMGRLNTTKHIEPYKDYCRHCAVLYSRVLEPLGYNYEIDISNCHEARCSLHVTKRSDCKEVKPEVEGGGGPEHG